MEKRYFFTQKYNKAIFALLIVLFCLRAINIDQDLAPWGVAQYQPVDEGAYSYMAINEKTYGSINPHIFYEGQELGLVVKENFISNVPGNFMSILGFHIWGNNYFGLRIPYVLWGLLVFVLFFKLIDKLRRIYGKGDRAEFIAEIAILAWYVTDFTFFNASRIAEPTMVRLVFVLLTALVYISFPDNHTTRFFVLGIFATFSTFLVYITNVFLFFAVGLSIIISIKNDGIKNAVREFAWFVFGSLCMFVVAEIYYYYVWQTEAILNSLRTIEGFVSYNSTASLTVDTSEPLIRALALVWAKIVGSNSFLYNLPILLFFSVKQRKIFSLSKNDKCLFFLQLIVLCFIGQTFISWDTVTRKIILICPIVVSILYVLFVSCDMKTHFQNSQETGIEKNNRKAKAFDAFLWIFGLINVAISLLYRTVFYNDTHEDYDLASVIVLLVLELFPILIYILFVFIIPKYIRLNDSVKLQMRAGWFVFICMCLCNLTFTYKYFLKNPSFVERDSMIALAESVDGKYVLGGGFQLGYSLYNDMKPLLTTPNNTMEFANILDEPLLIEYTSVRGELEEYFRNVYYSEGEGNTYFIPEKEIERSFLTFGYVHDMCLYKVGTAEDYRAYREALYSKVIEEKKLQQGEEVDKTFENDSKAWSNEIDRCIYPYTEGAQYPIKGKEVTNIIGSVYTDITVPVYGNVYGDIHGSINQPIHGSVYGDIYGDINSVIDSNVYGVVHGKNKGNVSGKILGNVLCCTELKERGIDIDGDFIIIEGNQNADVNSNVYGDIDFDIYGDINGYVFGDINGDVYGNITGGVFGKVNGKVYGEQVGYFEK
ncbi:hypothetical protein [Butyrivibrio sp. XPD2006]|uniref:hypothetical protein n=1 Tax=Butyrivibrio sp. XPD2006 TaxID=1280668 RepID=UPI0003B72444|nr:hypothetical protein [Butyrivibrio sp. XPD2006]